MGNYKLENYDSGGIRPKIVETGKPITNASLKTEHQLDLLRALTQVAVLLHQSPQSETQLLKVLNAEIVRLSLWGGLNLITDQGQRLAVNAASFPGSVLVQLENIADAELTEFNLPLTALNTYQHIVETKQAIFVGNSSSIIAPLFSKALHPLADQLLQTVGALPAIFTPVIVNDQVQGVFTIIGNGLTSDDIPIFVTFTDHIAIALDNTQRFMAMQRVEARLRNLNDELTTSNQILQHEMAELKQAEEKLMLLSTAIEQTSESVVITDTAGAILYVNPAFEQVSGYSRAEAIGQNPRLRQSGKHDPAFYKELWDTIRAGQVWHGRFINKKKNGEFYTEEASLAPVRNKQGKITNYVSVQRDVTRELQLEAQYRQAQKMEAVGRLAAGITHDFNNLLTVINGFAALMQPELSPDSPLCESVEKILHSGERATRLVRQLLAFSRKQTVEPQIVRLNNVVDELDKMLRRIIGEDIELVTILTPELWYTKVDPTQIEQVIINLAVNARDAMPDGGKLTIETTNIVLDKNYAATHLDTQPGEYVLLSMSDTGIGMNEEVKAHLFEPFFTTKETGKGTGLGLATVFGIVKQSSGSIWVYSEPGQGTTFKIYLPALTKAEIYSPGTAQSIEIPRGEETILVVEDETRVLELATRILRLQGYKVIEATDGQQAWQLAQESNQEIHLLLTDVIMPHMSGKALANQMKAQYPDLKILFTSGYTDHTIAQHGVLQPGVMFIQKPFSPIHLARKVREVLDQ
jgi:PAS domain S-box-containing protein